MPQHQEAWFWDFVVLSTKLSLSWSGTVLNTVKLMNTAGTTLGCPATGFFCACPHREVEHTRGLQVSGWDFI